MKKRNNAIGAGSVTAHILGRAGIPATLIFNGYNYAYKTKGGRAYAFITVTGERLRISGEKYNSFCERYKK